MRILFALPGLHLFNRGAEVAFIAIAKELARLGETVTLIGSGTSRDNTSYRFLHAGSIARHKFESLPALPALRNEFAYEDLTFIPSLLVRYRPADYDVTLTCSFPFTNLALRRPKLSGSRPPHVFVTQNGDWPAYARNSENRVFGCDGLICTNPDYYERNRNRWMCELIPNGVDCQRFRPGLGNRLELGIPADKFLVLMVSALDPTKRVETGIDAVSRIPGAHLIVAGDGPLRDKIDLLAAKMLPNRFTRVSVAPERMPALYQSADVFLHLSQVESFGNVFLEAMACGLPIVGFDSQRTRWIVGDDEYLFRDDDPLRIVGKLQDTRKENTEEKHARRARAEEFSWSKIAMKYQTFLRKVLDRLN
jgi:glycosyltransferase involved in cell wall biosynthesis